MRTKFSCVFASMVTFHCLLTSDDQLSWQPATPCFFFPHPATTTTTPIPLLGCCPHPSSKGSGEVQPPGTRVLIAACGELKSRDEDGNGGDGGNGDEDGNGGNGGNGGDGGSSDVRGR